MGKVLSILIPALVLGYAAYLIVSRVRLRKSGKCMGCSGCPYANGCDQMERRGKKKQ